MSTIERSHPAHTAGDPQVVLDALRSHVPLTLLMDLGEKHGPASTQIAESEGGDADWLPAGTGEPADADGTSPWDATEIDLRD